MQLSGLQTLSQGQRPHFVHSIYHLKQKTQQVKMQVRKCGVISPKHEDPLSRYVQGHCALGCDEQQFQPVLNRRLDQ